MDASGGHRQRGRTRSLAEIEDPPVSYTHEQHRVSPTRYLSLRSANIANRAAATLASTGGARRELLIERACEYDRRFVTDLKLHGDDRWNVTLDQAIRPPRRTDRSGRCARRRRR